MHKITFTYALLIALFVQAFIPVGYMPKTNTDGSFTLEICTSQGIELVTMNTGASDSQKDHSNNSASPHNECPYAPLNAALNVVDDHIQSPALIAQNQIPFHNQIQTQPRLQNYASRAPPLLSLI